MYFIRVFILLIPLFIILRYYYITKVGDFLIFGCITLLVIINSLSFVFPVVMGISLRRLEDISFISAIVLVFLYISRIRWSDTEGYFPKILIYLYTSILIGLAIFLDNLNDILYNTSLAFFRIIVSVIVVTVYFATKPTIRMRRILIAKKLWILVGLLNLFSPILTLIELHTSLNISQIIPILNFTAFAIVWIITIVIPEAILISNVQVDRLVQKLYKQALEMQSKEEVSYPLSVMKNYVKTVKQLSNEYISNGN